MEPREVQKVRLSFDKYPGDLEAPKMELQGSQNGAPEVPRALKREPRRPSDIPKMEPDCVKRR